MLMMSPFLYKYFDDVSLLYKYVGDISVLYKYLDDVSLLNKYHDDISFLYKYVARRHHEHIYIARRHHQVREAAKSQGFDITNVAVTEGDNVFIKSKQVLLSWNLESEVKKEVLRGLEKIQFVDLKITYNSVLMTRYYSLLLVITHSREIKSNNLVLSHCVSFRNGMYFASETFI